jgi:hypothetical protein
MAVCNKRTCFTFRWNDVGEVANAVRPAFSREATLFKISNFWVHLLFFLVPKTSPRSLQYSMADSSVLEVDPGGDVVLMCGTGDTR